MKLIYKVLLCSFFFSTALLPFSSRSFMAYRPEGLNLAKQYSGITIPWSKHFVSASVEYSQSRNNNNAIENFFFDNSHIRFSGSRVANRNPNDILADYFGLPTDFESSISFNPHVKNTTVNLDFFWNLHKNNDCGWSIYIQAPITHSTWALNPCETVINPGVSSYPAGYMGPELLNRSQLLSGALDVLSDCKKFGDLAVPLQYGKIARKSITTNKLADIYGAITYEFVAKKEYSFGINAHVIVPTGTRSNSCYLFEPQIGSGKHWGFGTEIHGHYTFFDKPDHNCSISVTYAARLHHLFKSKQKRSYDLINNGPGSRYMLLEDMITSISMNQGFSITPGEELINKQYITRLFHAIDATTLNSEISVPMQGELLASINITQNHFNCSIGYNLWARSAERLNCREKFNHKSYGAKGDAQLYGYIGPVVPDLFLSIPLNATQSKATLNQPASPGNSTNNFVNANADNSEIIFNVGSNLTQTKPTSVGSNTGVISTENVNGSNQAIVLSDNDINDCSGLAKKAVTHKIFGSIGYLFDAYDDYTPFLNIGAETEFAHTYNGTKTTISKWGFWLKCGVVY